MSHVSQVIAFVTITVSGLIGLFALSEISSVVNDNTPNFSSEISDISMSFGEGIAILMGGLLFTIVVALSNLPK